MDGYTLVPGVQVSKPGVEWTGTCTLRNGPLVQWGTFGHRMSIPGPWDKFETDPWKISKIWASLEWSGFWVQMSVPGLWTLTGTGHVSWPSEGQMVQCSNVPNLFGSLSSPKMWTGTDFVRPWGTGAD